MKKLKIRKLTPSECAKLMGLTSEDDAKMKAMGISDSARYKIYGNGIVSDCVKLIFQHLYKAQEDENYACEDKLMQ